MLTHLSLFSGIGGIDLAAEWAGFTTVGQCEMADYPTKVLEKHWPDVPRWRDVRNVTADKFKTATGLSTVTIVSAGYPCQTFSLAGKQTGDLALAREFIRVVRELRPRWAIGENVGGMSLTALTMLFGYFEMRATPQGHLYYELETWAHHTDEEECFLWPTPSTSQIYKKVRNPSPSERKGEHGQNIVGVIGKKQPNLIGQYVNPNWADWLMGFPIGWTDISNEQ